MKTKVFPIAIFAITALLLAGCALPFGGTSDADVKATSDAAVAAAVDDLYADMTAQAAASAQKVSTAISWHGRIIRIHAAVAVHRHAQRQIVVDHVVIAKLRDQEIVRVAFNRAVNRTT